MASLHARHSRSCLSGRDRSKADKAKGCSCGPVFYIRRGGGKPAERVGKNYREAERALKRAEARIEEGTYEPVRRITFAKWAEEWLTSVEVKDTTKASYRSTVAYAVEAFGSKVVRDLSASDITALSAHLRDAAGLSDTTRAKHLRVLSGSLRAAVEAGYAASNPVDRLTKSQRPRRRKPRPSHFTDDEISRLIPELPEGTYRVLVQTALGTGVRLSELLALRWGDVNLLDGEATIARSWTGGRLSTPKNGETRTVALIGLVDLLGEWWAELASPADDVLVFPGAARDGHLDPTTVLTRVLYPAMKRAGIPREGEWGELRTFHSLRHTHARRVLEARGSLSWLKEQLGHSSITVTVDVYGHWSREAAKDEARRLSEALSA